jgi:hypothetical protein
MSNSELNIKKIKKLVIRGLGWGYIPLTIIALTDPLLKDIPGSEAIIELFSFWGDRHLERQTSVKLRDIKLNKKAIMR